MKKSLTVGHSANFQTRGFASAFGKYLEVEEITSEITTEVLKEVRVFPGNRFEIVWNYQDELEKLILDLKGDHQDGE